MLKKIKKLSNNKLFISEIDGDFILDNVEGILKVYFKKVKLKKFLPLNFMQKYIGDGNFLSMVAGESLLHYRMQESSKIMFGKGITISTTSKFPQGYDAFSKGGDEIYFGEVKYRKSKSSSIRGIADDYNKFQENSNNGRLTAIWDDTRKEQNISNRKYKTIKLVALSIYERHNGRSPEELFMKNINGYDDKVVAEIIFIQNDVFEQFKDAIYDFIGGYGE